MPLDTPHAASKEPSPDWQAGYVRKGIEVCNNLANVVHALRNAPDLKDLLAHAPSYPIPEVYIVKRPFYERGRGRFVPRLFTDNDVANFQVWLQVHGKLPMASEDTVQTAMRLRAQERRAISPRP